MDGELPKIDGCASCGFDHVECQQVGKLTWRVVCIYCGEHGDKAGNMIDAIEKWNQPVGEVR
jgi:hypothetical protein